MAILNLIWQTKIGEQTEFEFEYTTEILFKKFNTVYYFDHGSFETIKDNSVVIYANDDKNVSPEFIYYLNKFLKYRYRFFLLHLSNESLKHDCWYYSKANYVFRNYFDPLIKLKNVCFIPLGFKSGYLNKDNNLNDCKDKCIDIAFMGQLKSDRLEMMTAMENIKSHYLHKTNSWNCTTALSQEECIDIYKKTKYAPCPMGNVHPDSFRLCESLEWGCIPVVRKIGGVDYFKNIFGNHPFRVIDEWNEIIEIVNDVDYCHNRESVYNWYSEFKEALQLTIKKNIDSGGVEGNDKSNTIKNAKSEVFRIYRLMRTSAKPYLKKMIRLIKHR